MVTAPVMWRRVHDAASKLGFTWSDYQMSSFKSVIDQAASGKHIRACLYYRTGAGKSVTAMVMARIGGADKVLVISPPSTHQEWERLGDELGMEVQAISVNKFRQKTFRLNRTTAVIADELHLFGGAQGIGWKKLDRAAEGLQAPLILASATPNYNDAERVYCVAHVLDPQSYRGGYLTFLHTHCVTKLNPFSQVPDVTGFINFTDAAAFLASMDQVHYLPDDRHVDIQNYPIYRTTAIAEIDESGFDMYKNRFIASAMEREHRRQTYARVDSRGQIHSKLVHAVMGLCTEPALIFCVRETVAFALSESLREQRLSVGLITGTTLKKKKTELLNEFRQKNLQILVGTASIATGTDGLDKVCDRLIIFDDTNDDALRKQLIGRILPRGINENPSGHLSKEVIRFVLED